MPTPIDSSLATWEDEQPRLLAGRCASCGACAFPRPDGCPRCGGESISQIRLSRHGTLWTWTTQGFLPKHPYVGVATPETFAPYMLGYVELPEGVMVEGWLVDVEPDEIEIGQSMELTTFVMETSDERGRVVTFGFRPSVEVTA